MMDFEDGVVLGILAGVALTSLIIFALWMISAAYPAY